jgi:hypothetical protein
VDNLADEVFSIRTGYVASPARVYGGVEALWRVQNVIPPPWFCY